MRFPSWIRAGTLGLTLLFTGHPDGRAQDSFLISSQMVVPTASDAALVIFSTSAPAQVAIEYGPANGGRQSVSDDAFELQHAVMLSGLIPGVMYEGTITATGPDGSKVTAPLSPVATEGSTQDVTFEVMPQVFVLGPPFMNELSEALVVFTTNAPSVASVEYGAPNAVMTSVADDEYTQNHALLLTGLQPGQMVQYSVTTIGEDGSIRTLPASLFVADALPRDYGPGDLNGDGRVTIADAQYALTYVVGTRPFAVSQVWAADLNKDGVVNIRDVTLILRWAVDLATLGG
jgi:hypothetical protein